MRDDTLQFGHRCDPTYLSDVGEVQVHIGPDLHRHPGVLQDRPDEPVSILAGSEHQTAEGRQEPGHARIVLLHGEQDVRVRIRQDPREHHGGHEGDAAGPLVRTAFR